MWTQGSDELGANPSFSTYRLCYLGKFSPQVSVSSYVRCTTTRAGSDRGDHTDTQHGAWHAATALSLLAVVVRLFGQRELMSMDPF